MLPWGTAAVWWPVSLPGLQSSNSTTLNLAAQVAQLTGTIYPHGHGGIDALNTCCSLIKQATSRQNTKKWGFRNNNKCYLRNGQ